MIDNAHDMCPASWLLLEELIDECYSLVIVLLINTDTRDRMMINSQSIRTFEEV